MEKWNKISEKSVYRGYRNIIRKTFQLPNGAIDDFDVLEDRSWVHIAAMTENQEIILLKQYRPGPEKFLFSFPSGMIDEGETPIEAAQRELLEETGHEATTIDFVREIHWSYGTDIQYCFVASGCRQVAEQDLDNNEFIEISTLSLQEFKKILKNPDDTSFISIGLGYLALEKWEASNG